MSEPIQCTDCTSISNFPEIGFGTVVNGLKEFYNQVVNEFRNTETLGRMDEIRQSLNDVFEECSQEGWDGYDALPITEDAYYEAERLIKSLPLTSFPMPEITPGPNGEIDLVWYRSKRLVFIASVSGKNEIVYAGLFGLNKANGQEYFGVSLSSAIIANLKRLYED
ncbi:MAG: hypothetical protein ACE5HI_20250 [bacterium]